MSKAGKTLRSLSLAAMLLVIGWLLPFVTGQIPEIGVMLSPMHIPVFLTGFILGPWWGLLIGFIMPLSRSLLFGMPFLFPTAVAMAFELAVYGLVSGILFHSVLKKKKLIFRIYGTLLVALILGKVVWGLAQYASGFFAPNAFTLTAFLQGAFILAFPGIILQLVLIPALIKALHATGWMKKAMA